MKSLKAGHVLGDYTIIRFVARGGMGEVYEAHDDKLHRTVALKVLSHESAKAHDSAKLIERFMLEARNLARVNHPNVVTVHAIHSTGANQYIAMEYVDGVSLKDFIEEYTLPIEVAAVLFEQVLSAVRRLHEHKIIHRDIKPSNILVRTDGQIKILDLGISKTEEASSNTNPGVTVGTPYYMSPELRKFEPASFRSDLWAVGAIFFECLTGVRLWDRIENNEFKLTKSDREAIPEEMRAIIASLCAPDLTDRYARASEALEDLLRFRAKLGTPNAEAFASFHSELNQLASQKNVTSFDIELPPQTPIVLDTIRPASTKIKKSRPKSEIRRERALQLYIGVLSLVALGAIALLAALLLPMHKSEPIAEVRKVIPAKLIEPADGETVWLESTQNPIMTWSQIAQPGYKLQIALDARFEKVVFNESVSGNSYVPNKPLAEGTYFWRILSRAATEEADERSFAIARLTPPRLLSPQDNLSIELPAHKSEAEVEFQWVCPRIPRPFHFQVSKDSNFSRIYFEGSYANCQTAPIRFSVGEFHWRVKPDVPRMREMWSPKRVLTVSIKASSRRLPQVPTPAPVSIPKLAATKVKSQRTPAATMPIPKRSKTPHAPSFEVPILVSPTDGLEAPSRNGKISIEFNWFPANEAVSYTFEISRDPKFSSVLKRIPTTDTRALVEQLVVQGRIYWRVKAHGTGKRSSEWSDANTVNVK